MIQIKYDYDTNALRFEFPPDWDAASITGINITVRDTEGTDLLAATAATLYTAVALNGALAVDDNSMILGGTPGAISPGDRFRIKASADGPSEDVEALFYASATKTVTLSRDLRHAHTTATNIYPLWCTYDLDTEDTDDFPKSEQVVLDWAPVGIDAPSATQRAEIGIYQFALADFEEAFSIRYPTSYEVGLTSGITKVAEQTQKQIAFYAKGDGINIDRIIDQDLFIEVALPFARRIVLRGGDDSWTTEREVAEKECAQAWEAFRNLPIWQDTDQDTVEDALEKETHDAGSMIVDRGY